ncbi:hypothetical protein [Hymenobacter sp. 102]|uniref:hypothetical protein n=1 Tax=Hymenobacter sp. 102 TaxID=3403152 RepID=UPI003CEDE4F5
MMDKKYTGSVADVDRLLHELLIGTSVESFGVSLTTPFIDFRDTNADEIIHLHFDADIVFYPSSRCQLTKEELMLVGMNSIHLKRVVKVNCTDSYDLEIQLEGGTWFKICGDADGYEPWRISKGLGKVFIEPYLGGGGCAIWAEE